MICSKQETDLLYKSCPSVNGRKGFVPEAILEVEKFGFEQINLQAIEAKIDPRNDNSKKILQRNNYQFDRLVQKEMVFQDEELDSEYYIKFRK